MYIILDILYCILPVLFNVYMKKMILIIHGFYLNTQYSFRMYIYIMYNIYIYIYTDIRIHSPKK